MLGMPTALSDLDALLALFEAREDDHRKWIEQLDRSIRDHVPFPLALDPHKCAFGRWYDSLKTDNVVLSSQLRKIDEPHRQIHLTGAEALEHARQGRRDEALALAAHIRTKALAHTLALFQETRVALREAHREIAVIVRSNRRRVAAVADAIESVEELAAGGFTDTASILPATAGGVVGSLARRAKSDRLVLTLCADRLLTDACASLGDRAA